MFRNILVGLAALYCMGLGFIALMPPFEGHDEIAHYSRIKESAFGDHRNLTASGRLITSVLDYATTEPMPYGWCNDHLRTLPCFSYSEFSEHPEALRGYVARYREAPASTDTGTSSAANWEYQHPPLYYYIFGRIDRHLSGLSLVSEILVLRVFSWTLAFAGFSIGLYATWRYLRRHVPEKAGPLAGLMALYPFVMPMFIPEFARMGNDSLLLFLFGLIWAAALAYIDDDRNDGFTLVMGLLLGFAALTKIPGLLVGGSVAAFFLLRACMQYRRERRLFFGQVKNIGAMIGLCLGISLVWYVSMSLRGNFPGSFEISDLLHAAPAHRQFDLPFILSMEPRYWSYVLHSFVWFVPTSSELSPESIRGFSFYAQLLVVLPLVAFGAYGLFLRKADVVSAKGLPAWLILPYAAGLFLLVLTAIMDRRGMPIVGWYFHTLAPAIGLAFAYGALSLMKNPWGKIGVAAGCLLAGSLLILAPWLHAALYGGCLDIDRHREGIQNGIWYVPYAFAGPDFCLGHFGAIFGRIDILAWPRAAILLLAAGWAGMAFSMFRILRTKPESANPRPPLRRAA